MGISTLQPITLPKLPNASSFLLNPSLPHRQTFLAPSAALLSRSICLRNLYPRAMASEERSNGFDKDDAGSVVLYGAGFIVALWLISAVIGAIDSIPLFPKLLEVVGLAYIVWFSSRYLIFKQNRDELSAKIEELKEQIFGSKDN